jgi:A/G-specific adenine glycosylase
MLKGPELHVFREQLLGWFREFQRDLPWRRTRDPYRIWISEIMLQQTRVAAVIPYYARFLEHFPTVEALAKAPQDEVLRLWSGLGYYSRARNLQKAAQQIVARHKGIFPENEEAALALPGIGQYTTAAILSIAYGEKHAVLDGNVARVLARLFTIHGDLREPKRWQALQGMANELLDPSTPGDWNQAMMELGATVCTPKSPQCLLCPVSKFCGALRAGLVDELPEKRKKRNTVEVVLTAAVFVDAKGRTLLLPPPKKTAGKISADDIPTLVSKMWHFPMFPAKADPRIEIRRQLRACAPISMKDPSSLDALEKVRHAVTYRSVTIFPFRVSVNELPRIQRTKCVALDDVSSMTVSNLTRKIAQAALAAPSAKSPKRQALSFRPARSA